MDTIAIPAWNAVDVVVVALIIFGGLQGLRRGLSGELARVIGTVITVWAGWVFYQPLGDKIYSTTRLSATQARAGSFVLILIGGFVLLLLLRMLLHQIIEFTFKGKLERMGGILAGTTRATLVMLALVFLCSLWPHEYIHQMVAVDSFTGRFVNAYIPDIYEDIAEHYPQLPRLQPRDEGYDDGGAHREEPVGYSGKQKDDIPHWKPAIHTEDE